ncbi:hypothetical protein [Pseudomonas paralcaligenes]|uniref:hypothetical protein n=1 Tax=Pseudomonas paralcaligenes TaxID=2772558 RepID=UPI001C804132|nr:hypothetical protein [Pseudomonas paralcaligenes]
MTIHYALQPAEGDEPPVAVFSVEIEGGSLSTACVMTEAEPAGLGSMAGIICNHLYMNAKYFPGEERAEARTERRVLHYANHRETNGVLSMVMAEFDVVFTPSEEAV